MKMTRGRIVALALLLLGIGIAAFLLYRTVEGPKVDAMSPVVRPLLETLVTSGRVIQRRQSELGTMVQSTVAEVRVDSGDRVEADALLVRLVDDDARARRIHPVIPC